MHGYLVMEAVYSSYAYRTALLLHVLAAASILDHCRPVDPEPALR